MISRLFQVPPRPLIRSQRFANRPIWRQKQHRVSAHIMVCFLTYVLWKRLGQWMQRSGLCAD